MRAIEQQKGIVWVEFQEDFVGQKRAATSLKAGRRPPASCNGIRVVPIEKRDHRVKCGGNVGQSSPSIALTVK